MIFAATNVPVSRVRDVVSDFINFASGASMTVGLRYLVFAGLAWLLAYVLFRRRWFHRKIVQQLPDSADVRREMMYSAVSLAIFSTVGGLTALAAQAGWTQLYWNIGERGWGWFVASVGLAMILHDSWFYWTHRLMHHRALFRIFHRVHHLSRNPSPWAAYSFGPAEAFMQAMIFPLAITLIPMHPFAFALFMFFQITYNVLGHTGYEFHPKWLMDSWLGKFLNTPTNHAMHHEKIRGNYGLYFNVWDRVMGTNHPDYESRFREVTGRPRAR